MHNAGDTYLVLDGPSTASIKIKGSRFIAEALPVSDVSEAEHALASIRKRDYDATHHCSAWRIGKKGETFRYSDDGEPNSSAGLPIFRQIEGKALTNTMVVVVRYYGGTKLGTGGLVRAYGDAAKEALNAGFVWGYEGLINNIINKIIYKDKTKYKIILTGGYANFFKKILKRKILIDQEVTIKGIAKVYKEFI